MQLISRRLFVTSLGCARYAFSKSWDDQPFPAWTPEFVDRMLTDSPWAKPGTVAFELEPVQQLLSSNYAQIALPGGIGLPGSSRPSGGASSVRTEIYITTRWATALPIRRALALHEFGSSGLKNEKAIELLKRRDPGYVLEVAGFPATVIRRGAKRFAAELLSTARLLVPGRSPLAATSSHVPEYGVHLMATLRFPQFEDLDPNAGTVELYAESGRMKIQQRFKLKNMVYEGRLEL